MSVTVLVSHTWVQKCGEWCENLGQKGGAVIGVARPEPQLDSTTSHQEHAHGQY